MEKGITFPNFYSYKCDFNFFLMSCLPQTKKGWDPLILLIDKKKKEKKL